MTRRILVVEDAPSQLHVYLRVLRRAGFDVTGCETAQRGFLELTQGGPFDLVILDLNLPDLSGTKLLPLVRGVLEDELPPFVLITGSPGSCHGRDGLVRPQDWEEYRAQGFVDALSKPLNPRQLTTVVQNVLDGGHHANGEVDSSSTWIEAAQAWAHLEDAG